MNLYQHVITCTMSSPKAMEQSHNTLQKTASMKSRKYLSIIPKINYPIKVSPTKQTNSLSQRGKPKTQLKFHPKRNKANGTGRTNPSKHQLSRLKKL